MVCCLSVFILNLRLAFFFKVNFLRDCNGCFYKRIANSEEVRELVHGLGKVEQLGIVR